MEQGTFISEDFSLLLGNNGERFLKYLFDKYYKELCRLSFRYVGRSDIAEDIVQDIYISIWNKRHSLQYTGPVKPCFIRSVINASLNYINSQHAQQHFDDESKLNSHISAHTHFEMLEGKELEDMLLLAIEQLPDKCRTIFSMSRMSGLSHKEIAEKLNISTKTIEAQITIALSRLHQFLQQMGYFTMFLILFNLFIKFI